ncbi:receptor-type tyrosine-protein phosphatase F isoform X19 [Sus scrofa]|uniref:receptor-type tyrosine-protein phosphatase F isoform X19 n=1 Tax=Sus scrofa TaxID=9823 RepID=UPI000A2B1C0C|nr:receptor-type tyrosine-protein phosphatase F isoform X19 [Sus scrofa]
MAPKPAPGRTMMPLVPALVVLGLVAGAHGDSKPVFIKVPEDQTGLSGGVASFVCQATGEPKPRITWMKKGKKVSSQRFEVIEFDDGAGSVLRIQPLRVQRDEAIYECTATNSLGEINTSAKLSVLEEEQLPPGFPSIDMGPQLKVVEKARTATMLCAAGGNPDPEISWFKDFLPVDPATSNGRIKQLRSGALQIESSEESDQGKYECVATNSAGTRYSAPANLYVRDQREVRRVAPRFSIPPSSQEVMPGGSVNLTCVAVGAPMPYVKWMVGAEELTKEDEMPVGRNVLELSNVVRSANYTCVAISSLGMIEATAQVTVKALPKPPIDLVVTETTATSVTLTWDSGNSEPVSYYGIQYRPAGTEGPFQEVDGVATTRYSIGGLSPFSEYAFRVLAVNSIGRGPPSEAVRARTGEQAPSSPPRRVQARMLSASTMLVQWEPPEEPNGLVRGYRVYYTPDSRRPLSAWHKHNTDAGLLTTVGSLLPGITYSLRVLAFTAVGDGPPSPTIQVKTQQGVPAQPADFQAEADSDTRIRLSWLLPPQERVIKYELVYWAAEDEGQQHKVTFDPTSSYTLEDLKPDTLYRFQLAARSEMGVGVFTPTVEARTAQSTPSAPPQKVTCVSVGSTTVRVSWVPPPADSRNGVITQYSVAYEAVDGEDRERHVVGGIGREHSSWDLVGLEKWTEYRVWVRAHTDVGPGPESSPVLVRTDEDVPSGPPRKVEVDPLNSTAVRVSWKLPVPSKQHGQIRGYQVTYVRLENGEPRGPPVIQDVMLAEAQWRPEESEDYETTISGLTPETTYSITVAAYTTKGDGARSKPKIVTTTGAVFAKNFRVAAAMKTSVLLSWEVPDSYKSAVPFRILYNGQSVEVDGHSMQKLIANLQPNTEYSFVLMNRGSSAGGLQHLVSIRTAPDLLPHKPLPASAFIEDGRFTLSMPHVQDPSLIRWFYIMVVPIDRVGGSMLAPRWSTPEELELDELLEAIEQGGGERRRRRRRQTERLKPYVAAQVDVLPETFTLGDKKSYRGFYNRPLSPDLSYQCFVLASLKEPVDQKRYAASPYSDEIVVQVTPAQQQEEPEMLWVTGPVLAVILIILIVIAILLFKSKQERKRTQSPSSKDEQSIGLKDSLLAHSSDPVEMRRLNYQTPGSSVPSCPNISSMRDHPPIPVTDLADNIERLKANDGLKFSQEYESIDPGQQFTWENSNLEVNKPKNRYANVIAYDHSRVILTSIDGVPGSDYINANYIDGYRKQNAYIATQGPLPETMGDFWRMVWEQRTATVVMMTRLEEKSRVKCDQYWPARGTETYGLVQVTLLDTVELATYTVRTFALHKSGSSEKRELRQFQFMAWPDHGVPEYPTPILAFLRRVKACNPLDAGPMVVHCSAGVGRTGCFIVIDAMLERMKHEKTVDIYGHVTCMRAQRNYMVQTEDQYVFIHEALLEAATCGHTEVPARSLYAHIQKLGQVPPGESVTAMELEFKLLASSKAHTSRFISANLPCNKFKNRLVNIMPYELTRVCLQPIRGVEGSDYINASFLDGYRQQKAYIATQGPLAESTEDFWRMLWEHNSTIVVMLTRLREMGRVSPSLGPPGPDSTPAPRPRTAVSSASQPHSTPKCSETRSRLRLPPPPSSPDRGGWVLCPQEKCHQYWPAERSARYQYFVVDPMAEYNMPQYILREFKVTDARDGQSRTIRQFQFTDWPEQGVPKTGEGFIDFIGQVHKTKEQFGQDGPITVHCSAGVGRTGVFITLSIVLERMRYEGVVDMFQTVKTLRTQRPAMVQTEDQYQLCYRAALEYLGSFDHYAT